MKNKSIFIIIFVLILLVSIFLKVRNYNFLIKNQDIENTQEKKDYVNEDEGYYSNLEKECDNNCCLASVEKMKISNAKKAKNEKCEIGYNINRLLCIGSYFWCNKQSNNKIKKEISFERKIENYLVSQKEFSFKSKVRDNDFEFCSFVNLNSVGKEFSINKDSFPLELLVSCVKYSKKGTEVVKTSEKNNIPVLFELVEDLRTNELNKIIHKTPRNNSFYEKDLKSIFSEESIKKIENDKISKILKQKINKKFKDIKLEKFNKGIWHISREEDGKIKSKILRSSYLGDVKNVQDSREYQHGIDFLKKSDGDYVLIWSSSGDAIYPSRANNNNEWTHDVYYSKIDSFNPKIIPKKIIGTPLSQEPVSSAINKNGNIFVTMAGVWKVDDRVSQTYGVFDEKLKKIKSYQKTVFNGGHSGHVSATEDKFSVFYSYGLVNDSEINQYGIGNDVRMSIYDNVGELINEINVVAGNETRDWWPLIRSSKNKNFLLWQRFINGKDFARLMFAIYNLDTNSFDKKVSILKDDIKFYNYNIEYLESIDRFLVLGNSSDNRGFGILLNSNGDIITEDYNLTPIIRESQPAIKSLNKNEVKVVYPAFSGDIAMLSITADNIIAEGVTSVGYDWDISGTDGIFLDNNDVYFASLSAEGLKEIQIKIYEKLNY